MVRSQLAATIPGSRRPHQFERRHDDHKSRDAPANAPDHRGFWMIPLCAPVWHRLPPIQRVGIRALTHARITRPADFVARFLRH